MLWRDIRTVSVVNNVQGGMGSEGMSVAACLHCDERLRFNDRKWNENVFFLLSLPWSFAAFTRYPAGVTISFRKFKFFRYRTPLFFGSAFRICFLVLFCFRIASTQALRILFLKSRWQNETSYSFKL